MSPFLFDCQFMLANLLIYSSLIQNIRYFEWDQSKELPEVSLTGYLQLSKHFNETIS
jgi:hypothetical protein